MILYHRYIKVFLYMNMHFLTYLQFHYKFFKAMHSCVLLVCLVPSFHICRSHLPNEVHTATRQNPTLLHAMAVVSKAPHFLAPPTHLKISFFSDLMHPLYVYLCPCCWRGTSNYHHQISLGSSCILHPRIFL